MGDHMFMWTMDFLWLLFCCTLQFEHPICWSYVVDLYMLGRESMQSLTIVPKLKYEHIFLTSFSNAQVYTGLSATPYNCLLILQVMSGTVAHAILYKMKDAPEWKRPSMECTAKFIGMVDKMFDCLNVGNYTQGKYTRNCFKQPYRGPSDFHLKAIMHGFGTLLIS